MRKIFLLVCLCSLSSLFSQTGPRTWEDHLSISRCNTVAKNGNTVYASYYNGLVWFADEEEKKIQSLNKTNGLSDVGVKLLRANKYNNKLLVIYDNANIDIIDGDGKISNYSDFKLKALSGKKYVNEITFYKQYAYMACGFGIVVFDTDKLEIKDTYFIGPNAANIEVFQVALTDSLIFAATENGLYSSNHKTKILNDFHNWKLDTVALPGGPFCGVINVDNKVLCCYAPSKLNSAKKGKDTLYVYKNNTWAKHGKGLGTTIYGLGTTFGSYYHIYDIFGLIVRDINTGENANVCYTFKGNSPVFISDVYYDKDYSGNITYWIADRTYGLYQNYLYYTPQNSVNRNGTHNRGVGNIDVFEGKAAVSPAYVDVSGVGPNTSEGINILKDKEWSYYPGTDLDGKPIIDITSVLFDRKDKTKMWAAAWKYGVIEYRNNKIVSVRTPANTPEMAVIPGEPRCSGLSQDKDGNIWFAQSDIYNYLSVIKRNGEYQNFRFDNRRFTRKTFVDRNNVVWALHQGEGGITVFKHNGFNTPVQNVNYRVLSKDIGKGNLQSNAVSAIAEDQDGRIWIGTSEGISVFYNSAAIFSGSDYDSQPIKIVQDGNVELLLGHETVLCLAVDGANNKWAGTVTGGLYCFSPDGQTQLYHFTKENSPLYSNTIFDLNYDEVTGDILIGTDVGMQSFRSTVIKGSEQYDNVIAFPNPVRPNYQGTVLIKGLVDKSIVKIADESGKIVWEVKSSGGQIEWPVTTFAGSRVVSGVYVVYATTTTGELRALTKILVVN